MNGRGAFLSSFRCAFPVGVDLSFPNHVDRWFLPYSLASVCLSYHIHLDGSLVEAETKKRSRFSANYEVSMPLTSA